MHSETYNRWTWGMVNGVWQNILLVDGSTFRRSGWSVEERMGITFIVWYFAAGAFGPERIQTFGNLGEAQQFAEASHALETT